MVVRTIVLGLAYYGLGHLIFNVEKIFFPGLTPLQQLAIGVIAAVVIVIFYPFDKVMK